MSGRSIGNGAGHQINEPDPGRNVHARIFQAQCTVGGIENERRASVKLRDAAHDLTYDTTDDGGCQPVTRDVADREDDAPIDEVNRVVPVAADLRVKQTRFVNGVEGATYDLR